jgi:hypothetical protein
MTGLAMPGRGPLYQGLVIVWIWGITSEGTKSWIRPQDGYECFLAAPLRIARSLGMLCFHQDRSQDGSRRPGNHRFTRQIHRRLPSNRRGCRNASGAISGMERLSWHTR